MPAAARTIGVLCAAAAVACWLTGCAGETRRVSRPAAQTGARLAWPENSDAYARLVALRDVETPRPSPERAPEIRGLDTDALAPISPDDPGFDRAHMALADVLARRATPPITQTEAPEPPSEGALLRAERFYTSGVAKLLDNDPAGAARDFASAAQLDPTAPAPWLKLADAQARMGQAAASMLSRRKAVELGSDDALSLAVLGIQTARTGQHELAAHYLARCLASNPRRVDPLLRQVALVRIADPLAQLGYLRASNEALEGGLELPRQLRSRTRFADEAADIARRVSDLWLQIGDTACRLGDDARAAEAYATAAGVPSVDPSAIMARRAFVLFRSGRSASVALLVLDGIAGREGRADSRDLGLLAALRGDADVGALVREALDDLSRSLAGPRTPSTETMLALARATVSADARARAILAERASQAPDDPSVLGALFARCQSLEAIEEAALGLIDRSSTSARAVAGAMLPWHPTPGPLCNELPETPAGRLLRANLLLVLGHPVEALDATGSSPAGGRSPALAETSALAAANAGETDTLDATLALQVASPVACARALLAVQRYGEALRALAPALEDRGASIGTLLLGAELALGTNDADRALELLGRAAELDPFDERIYEGLINVRQSVGDQQGVAESIRQLRERVPSSRLLRWVTVQENARRGLLDQAERSARELVEDTPDSGQALGLLMTIWAQRNAVGDTDSLRSAAEWLAGLTREPPVTGEMLAAEGSLLQLLGRSEEAESLLRAALEARPSPPVSRALENLLLTTERESESLAVAEARLAAAGRGIEASLERAEYAARDGRWSDAVEAALSAMPGQATLTLSQKGRVLQLAGALTGALQGDDSAALNSAALSLLTTAETRGIELPWQLSYSRWALLSNAPEATAEEITSATTTLLERIDSQEIASYFIGDTASRLSVPVDTLELARGQVAYQLAGSLFAAGRDDAALEVYRVVLRYNPDHAWAANDLGYFLLERHEDLGEAERLLEHAYTLRPDQSNIADSIGWLRYKLGQLDNETREDGSVREGAVSLLIAATGLPGGETNATIHDHLGDALWRSGDRERARAEWIRAQQLLIGELAQLRDGGSSPRRDQLTGEQARVGKKLDALQIGEDPPVAPLIDR